MKKLLLVGAALLVLAGFAHAVARLLLICTDPSDGERIGINYKGDVTTLNGYMRNEIFAVTFHKFSGKTQCWVYV
jgi:hypothetical protein